MFVVVQASDLLAHTGKLSYHLNEMSDFQTDLYQKLRTLLAEAMALDLVMWKAKNHKSRRPWLLLSGKSASPYFGGLPNYASESDIEEQAKQFEAELVDQIYWQGKPAPRQSTQRSSQSLASLYSDEVKRHVSIEVRELAERLHISERQVRRKLSVMLKAGKIPADWREDKQWRPPVEQADQAMRNTGGKTHKPHTHTTDNACVEHLIQCRRKSEKLRRDIETIVSKLEICETWVQFFHSRPPAQLSPEDKADYEKARARGFTFLNQLAEKRRWSFCKLFVWIYDALLKKSATPVADTIGSLGLNHAAFYRRYTKKEIREALRMAERIQANSDRLGYAPQSEQKSDDYSSVFSDWANKVSEKDLWVDTH